MRKRIFSSMALLACISMLLITILLSGIFYGQFIAQARLDLHERTEMFADTDQHSALRILAYVKPDDMRITLLSPRGDVLFDNMADAQNLGSHLDREEIEEALSFGEGESRRFSQTLGTQTYYYARRLVDGSVLRTAKTVRSMWGMFAGVLPVSAVAVLLFTAIGYAISRRLAKGIVEPLDEVDFSGEPQMPYDELAPFARTITEHRRQIAQDSRSLQTRADTINAIMDNMNEGVVLLDRRGVILTINNSAARVFDAKTSMQGKSALELLRDLDFQRHIQAALQGERSEMTLRKADQEYRVLVSPVAETGVVVLFLNITEKARADDMRREFSANVSHELKTPLTSIYGYAEMLRGGVIKEDDKPQFYEKMMGEASRLIALIEDIMLLSQLDEEKTQQRFEEVALADVALACAQALGQKAAEHQVQVRVTGDATLQAGSSLMYELFYNLIDNGIKYNHPGGHVQVELAQAGSQVRITVSDDGIGIPEADRKRIFERFYRVDKSRSKKSGGTGLGLAIVKHIVLVHGGSIQVSGRPGEGTRFDIVFAG